MSSPAPADLWTRAADLLAAFTRAWGAAREIALKWTMHHGDLICALRALAPVEALARRLVFAEALTLLKLVARPAAQRRRHAPSAASGGRVGVGRAVRPPAERATPVLRATALRHAPPPASPLQGEEARAPVRKHVSPITVVPLPHTPHAFYDACNPAPLIHLRLRHPLEFPQEKWRVRFPIATFATKAPSDGARAPSPASASAGPDAGEGARAPGHAPRIPCERFARDPIKLRESRRARRAREKAEREKRWYDYWYGDPDAPRVLNTAFDPRPFSRFDSGALARRAEAVRRVIAAPARFARALARRLRKHVDAIPKIVTRLRRRRDENSSLAMQCIEAALAAPDTS